MSKPVRAQAVDLARETLKQLALRKMVPTPENFQLVYNRLAGQPDVAPPCQRLRHTLKEKLTAQPSQAERLAPLMYALEQEDLSAAEALLAQLLCEKPPAGTPPVNTNLAQAGAVMAAILRAHIQRQLAEDGAQQFEPLLDKLEQAESLETMLASLRGVKAFLKKQGAGCPTARLLRLLNLLSRQVSDLAADERWTHGQTKVIQDILNKPLSVEALEEAEAVLAQAGERQALLKQEMQQVQDTLRKAATTFMARLQRMEAQTGGYKAKMESYSQQIGKASSIGDLGQLVGSLLADTTEMQAEASQSHQEMHGQQETVLQAEVRIQQLEGELARVAELVHEDYLTGVLNRRGMDENFSRELARSDRQHTTVCVALLDIDHFKKLNDTYGHAAGDKALVFLAQLVKTTLRTTDLVARYGGEEFSLLLPDTALEQAEMVLERLQRELTKQLFMQDNSKVVITFSAGVAQRQPNEPLSAALARADGALYEAKQTGRNKVCRAGQA